VDWSGLDARKRPVVPFSPGPSRQELTPGTAQTVTETVMGLRLIVVSDTPYLYSVAAPVRTVR
jgi:hypothetical protein